MQCFSANPEVFEKSIIGIRLLGLILVALNAEQVGGMENREVRAPKSERGSVLNAASPPYKVARKRRCYVFKMATISIDRGSTMTI